jgi:two-component system phosphate regulon sensor histidine kinase PhoR
VAKLIISPLLKLTILFLFLFFIPGLILSYLSIQNIANQKELTEKRLLEEQNELATNLAGQFQNWLYDYAVTFFKITDSLNTKLPSSISIPDSLDFVAQAFIVDNQGQFIWPYYLHDSQIKQTHPKSRYFLNEYTKAEKLEFTKTDLVGATQTYDKSFKIAKNPAEQAASLNGLARVSTKRGYNKRAQIHYRTLAEEYGTEIDSEGVPFAYYSLHQLIRSDIFSPDETTYKDIEIILSYLNGGKIPLTDHVDLLMKEVSEWAASQDFPDRQSKDQLIQLTNSIGKKFTFAIREGNLIKQYISGTLKPTTWPVAGNFKALIGNSDDQPVLLITNSSPKSSTLVGFKVNLDTLKNKMLSTVIQSENEFEMEVDITSRQQIAKMGVSPYSMVKELSPLVPSWQIFIKPQNMEIINNYISTRRWVYTITLTFLIAGMFVGIILVLRDMSRERRIAQLGSDFVSNVTHELKTPLTSIRMLAETMHLGRIQKKNERQEYLSIIVNETERLTRLINNVLDFSKIEKNKKEYQFETIDLNDVVQSAVNSMAYWMNEQGFKIESDIKLNVRTKADGDAIEQAVLNLLSNAMKYSFERKEINLRCWTENQSIYIQVADKGIGIPESKQNRIFNKYYRAHVGHEQDKGGAGLGLTVLKHIIDAHQGNIELESKDNQGSRFTIILPVISDLGHS